MFSHRRAPLNPRQPIGLARRKDESPMRTRQRLLAMVAALLGAMTIGGTAAALAHATPSPPPPPPPTSQACDAPDGPEAGETPDQPGAPDTEDADQGPEEPEGPCH